MRNKKKTLKTHRQQQRQPEIECERGERAWCARSAHSYNRMANSNTFNSIQRSDNNNDRNENFMQKNVWLDNSPAQHTVVRRAMRKQMNWIKSFLQTQRNARTDCILGDFMRHKKCNSSYFWFVQSLREADQFALILLCGTNRWSVCECHVLWCRLHFMKTILFH